MSGLGRKNIVAETFLIFLFLTLRSETPIALPDSRQVIAFLNQTIAWYRHLSIEENLADQPVDVLLVSNNRQITDQILGLSFDFARADAQLMASQAPSAGGTSVGSSSGEYTTLAQLSLRAEERVRQKQEKLAALRQKLPSATGRARRVLQSTIDETQSDLDLAQTQSNALKSIVLFVAETGAKTNGGGDLMSQIAKLEQSVPEARTTATRALWKDGNASGNSFSSAATSANRRPEPSGIMGLGSDLIALKQKIHTLGQMMQTTDALIRSSRSLMAPLNATLTAVAQRGDELSNQSPSTDPVLISQRKTEIDALDVQFKQVSTAFLPLAKQIILLERCQENLMRWRDTVASRQGTDLRSLLLRLIALGLALILAFGMFEIWRRVTFHYVRDVRRRHQFLLLRGVLMIFTFATIVAISFSTDIGSLTTFAGLLAAGLAVCLQNVILSTLGYFVLLGKYGVRIGDRLQISGVTGNVVDIDLMRISLMEVVESGNNDDGMPTGRTVEFPNAVVFQPTVGLFKQIPGALFLWHELTLPLTAKDDYHLAEKRILEAIAGVFNDYREKLEFQHRQMERTLNSPIGVPRPQCRLRLTATGREVVIRYPVTHENAVEVDDRIARVLFDDTGNQAKLKAVGSHIPNTETSADSISPSIKPGPSWPATRTEL